MTQLMFHTTSLLAITVSIVVLTASAELHQNTLTVDATDRENWAYVNLTKGETVDIADPATSMAWDLGFKRTAVIANGGISGPGKTGALVLKDISFEDVLEAPEGDYVSDTDQIATFARGTGWYTYTGPPNHWVLPNPIVYALRIAVNPKAQPPSPYYYAKVRFIGYYENNETKEGSGNITIEYALQDDGTRSFIESVSTSVDTQRKLTTTWAAIKSN
ncbi:MAG: HmuY family protein [Candidatus Poribacteria bacterium]|nr:HmuY family protein [Candidatus Poribacteria bacterium]